MEVNVLTRFITLILKENAKTALIQLQDVHIIIKIAKFASMPAQPIVAQPVGLKKKNYDET
jgi:hypothetical protein